MEEENESLKKKLAVLNLSKGQKVKNIEEKYKILIKGKIVDDFKSKLSNNLLDGEKLVALNFISDNQDINHAIICKNKMKFLDVEGQLYEKFPEYRDSENIFMFNGKTINRGKTLEDNGIYAYTIMLQKIEE